MHFTTIALTALIGVAQAAPSPQPWCNGVGQPCWLAKRTVEAFEHAIASSPVGEVPYKTKRALDELAQVVSLASGDAGNFYDGLGLETPEEPAVEKREAAPEPWCFRVGQGCWKAKRAADEVIEAATRVFPESCDGDNVLCWKKREAAPEPEPWCFRVGQGCWKAKRDLAAMHLAARGVLESLE